MDIRPLTKHTQDGVRYQRAAHVTSQIDESTLLDEPALLARAAITKRDDPAYLVEETLIYFLREATHAGKINLVNQIADHLLRRCSKTIRRQLSRRGVYEDNLDDAAADVIDTLFTQITDVNGDQGDYLQVRFFDGLLSLSVKTAIQYRRRQHQQASAVALDGEGDQEFEEESALTPQISDQDLLHTPPTVEDMALACAALDTLDPHIRRVFVLHHYYRFPIESNDPSIPTLSTKFGKTPRTIRNWLRRADEQLGQWRSEEQA